MSHVLIVDDEPLLLNALQRLVKREGHTVHNANGLTAAQQASANQTFHVALVDYSLGGPDGLQVLKMLRETQPGCARVLMSGHLEIPVIVEALNEGLIHQILAKPISRASLRNTLDTCLDLQQRLQHDLDHIKESAISQERSLIQRFLDDGHLQLALQPILSAQEHHLIAYEALLRSTMPELRGPMDVISTAEHCDRLLDIAETVAIRAAEWLPQMPLNTMLFINLHPTELNTPERLLQNLAPLNAYADRVVLEVTEHSQVQDSWISTITRLRDKGYSIAVDDLGAGYNSLMTLATLQPDYIKVDMSITRDININDYKQRLMALLVQLANGTNSTLLAEGVETDDEADTLVNLGVHLVQGYRFGRPLLTPDFTTYKPLPLNTPAASPQSPVSQSPVSQSPVSQSPVSQSPVSQSPVSESPPIESAIEHSDRHSDRHQDPFRAVI